MIYDKEEVIIQGEWLHCPEKKVKVKIDELKVFMVNKTKREIGFHTESMEPCFIYEDDHYVHIGCLKETKIEFRRKYIELVKQLNNQ